MSNTLSCCKICKNFNKTKFLHDISIEVSTGKCLGILGNNGSGKSTIMSVFAGLSCADNGEILYNNIKINKEKRLKIGYVAQEPSIIEYLTVKENLKLWLDIYNLKNFDNIPKFLNIDDMLNKKVSKLSGGMKKKVCIAIALMNNPDFLILDEAFSAVDHDTIEKLIEYIKQNRQIGIIYSSHSIYEISKLCTDIIVLKNGEITYKSENIEKFDDEYIKFIYSKF